MISYTLRPCGPGHRDLGRVYRDTLLHFLHSSDLAAEQIPCLVYYPLISTPGTGDVVEWVVLDRRGLSPSSPARNRFDFNGGGALVEAWMSPIADVFLEF